MMCELANVVLQVLGCGFRISEISPFFLRRLPMLANFCSTLGGHDFQNFFDFVTQQRVPDTDLMEA